MSSRYRLPMPVWLSQYQRAWLSDDLQAGVTLAAYAVPVSLAYATLAGLPPQMGLYCYLLGGIGYAIAGSSRHLAIGPTSAISLVLGVALLELVGTNTDRLAVLASMTALVMAAVFALAWLLRLSVLVNFISESILTGFKAGAALVIGSTQVPKLLGIAGGGDAFFERVWLVGQQLSSSSGLAMLVGGTAIVLLLAGDKYLRGWPVALIVVLLALGVVPILGLDERGLPIVGHIPAGLPQFLGNRLDISTVDLREAQQIVRLAGACFLLSYIESISAARTFALKHHYDINPRQELLALGLASLLTGLFQGFPIAGGLSQTAVNERGGARTPLSLLVASATLACVLLFLTGLFRTLPDAVLAAIVLVAIAGLIDLRELSHLWKASRLDFAASMIAFAGVLFLGVLDGVMVAVFASVGLLLWRGSQPYVAFLGRIPGTQRFSDIARHSDNEPLQDVLAFRPQTSLMYFNADSVRETVLKHARMPSTIRRVICDLSNVPYVDIAGARMLRRLHGELKDLQMELKVAEAHGPVREMLRGEGLEELVGDITRHVSLAELVEFRESSAVGGVRPQSTG